MKRESHQKAAMMKVLHVYKFYTPVWGGGISAIESVIEGLRSVVESRVLAATRSGPGSQEYVGSARVRRTTSLGYINSMPIAPTLPYWFWRDIRHVDIVHLHLPFPIADFAVNFWRPRIPLIVHWHSDIVQQTRLKRMLRPLLRNTLESASKIIVGSKRHIENSEDLLPFKDKCTVVPYGLDVDKWSKLTPSEATEVEKLRAENPRMVFFLGRLVAYKGLTVLLEAMTEIDGKLIIGGDGPMLPILQDQARKLQIENKVDFVGGLSFTELKKLYHACSLFVLPSIFPNEAFGLVQLEAMSCGKPIVNTDLPTGVPLVARNEKEGVTVPPGDAHALADGIRALLDNPKRATVLGRAGHARVMRHFSQTTYSGKMYSIYEELLNTHSCKSRLDELHPATR